MTPLTPASQPACVVRTIQLGGPSWESRHAPNGEGRSGAPEERFSLHELKRKGGTDMPGTRAEKQDARGVTEAMMKIYDKSVPLVTPSA